MRTASEHLDWVEQLTRLPELIEPRKWGIHAVLVPEIAFTSNSVAAQLESTWNRQESANIFISEGAGAAMVRRERQNAGQRIGTDAFGHPKLDQVRVGEWLADELALLLDAERTLVVKSGYFARSGPANAEDRALINRCATTALVAALDGTSGIVGQDSDQEDAIGVIEFERVHGGRRLATNSAWVQDLLARVS